MSHQANIGIFVFGSFLAYDAIKAAKTYLYLARIPQIFEIGDLHQIQNLSDLFSKILFVVGLLMFVNSFLSMIAVLTQFINSSIQKPIFGNIADECISDSIKSTIIFSCFYFKWIRVAYQENIDRALLFPALFLVQRFAFNISLRLESFMQIPNLRFITKYTFFWLCVIMILEIYGLRVVDSVF